MPIFDLYLPRTYSAWRRRRERIHPAAAAWILFATWIERARQRKALAVLDDHQLRDDPNHIDRRHRGRVKDELTKRHTSP